MAFEFPSSNQLRKPGSKPSRAILNLGYTRSLGVITRLNMMAFSGRISPR